MHGRLKGNRKSEIHTAPSLDRQHSDAPTTHFPESDCKVCCILLCDVVQTIRYQCQYLSLEQNSIVPVHIHFNLFLSYVCVCETCVGFRQEYYLPNFDYEVITV